MQYAFFIIYSLEVLAKIYSFGLKKYLDPWQLSVIVVLLNVMMLVSLVLFKRNYTWYKVLKYIMMIRLLRVLSYFQRFKKYKVIFDTFVYLMPIFGTLFGVMVSIYYFYCSIGIFLFGGKVYKENPLIYKNPSVPLTYVYINFNDFLSGLIALFHLMVVNNWQVSMGMFVDVSQSQLSYIFFVSYYFICVFVGLNLCVAFVLDMFNSQWEIMQSEEDSEKTTKV